MMTALLAGAVVGAGIYALVRIFVRPQPSVAVLVARIDSGRRSLTPTFTSELVPERASGGFLEPDRRPAGAGGGQPRLATAPAAQ
jgi:tight adherence protein C